MADAIEPAGKRRRTNMPATAQVSPEASVRLSATPMTLYSYKEDNPLNRALKNSAGLPVIFEREHTFALLDKFPAIPGHSLLVLKHRVATLNDDISPEAAQACFQDLQALVRAVQTAVGCPGVKVIQNNGPAAGQTVPQLHYHVLPSWPDREHLDVSQRLAVDEAVAGPLLASIRNHLPASYCNGYHVWAPNCDDMEALGWALHQSCQAGAVVLLEGQLGAGKSTLARGFIRAFCKDRHIEVPSPTFLLCLSYDEDVAHEKDEQAAVVAAMAAVQPQVPGDSAAAPAAAAAACSTEDRAASGLNASTSAPASAPAVRMRVHHMDPYRLGTKNGKMAGLIDFSAAFKQDVCLIEWPDRMPEEVMAMVHAGLRVQVTGTGTQASGRLVSISALNDTTNPAVPKPAKVKKAKETNSAATASSASVEETATAAATAETAARAAAQQHYTHALHRWRASCPASLPPAAVDWKSSLSASGSFPEVLNPVALRALEGDPREWLVLGIESSCDDTAAAVVRGDGTILAHTVASQTGLHEQYGGVKPDVACQAHAAAITSTVGTCLAQAGVSADALTAVAVTCGPGLALCLQVGVRHAVHLAWQHQLPLVPVHHMEAHALMSCLPGVTQVPVTFPALLLLVSGGHNMLVFCEGVGKHRILGTTLDDSVGECFDKIARLVGITAIPGGPHLERLAVGGNPKKHPLPMPLTQGEQKDTCNFSFSGLKTQVTTILLNRKKELGLLDAGGASAEPPPSAAHQAPAPPPAPVPVLVSEHGPQQAAEGLQTMQGTDAMPVNVPAYEHEDAGLAAGMDAVRAAAEAAFQVTASDVAAGFQATAVRFLQQRTRRALQWLADDAHQLGGGAPTCLVVAGGVAANCAVRDGLSVVAAEFGISCIYPPVKYCTDNGLMVAWTGVERLKLRLYTQPPGPSMPVEDVDKHVQVIPRWPIGPLDPRSAVGRSQAFLKMLH